MRLIFALLLVMSFLAGCATTANFEKKLNGYLGKTESQLVAEEGIPQGSYEADGVRFLTYSRSEFGYIPGQPPVTTTTYIGGKAYTNTSGGTQAIPYAYSCTVTFTIVNKLITSWKHSGNACKSYD